MTIRRINTKVEDKIKVQNVLVSVFNKKNLDYVIKELIKLNNDIIFYSTGGTYNVINEILKNNNKNLIAIEKYTDFPEMEGGLVKTLHPKIHAGILGERNNIIHQKYIQKTLKNGVYFDLIISNLYPFEEIISKDDIDIEDARGNIDIGGPTMLRAGAKNFLGCAVICDANDYIEQFNIIKENDCCTTLEQRFKLAIKVFSITSNYDKNIYDFISNKMKNIKIENLLNIYK